MPARERLSRGWLQLVMSAYLGIRGSYWPAHASSARATQRLCYGDAGRLSSVAAVPESDIAAAEAKVKRMVAEGKRKEKAAFGGLFAGKGGL